MDGILRHANAPVFLIALSYEIFAHDQNRRRKFRPAYENAPPDFFENGGWRY
jgi:hypothetical protein